jgi:hypothetical protein
LISAIDENKLSVLRPGRLAPGRSSWYSLYQKQSAPESVWTLRRENSVAPTSKDLGCQLRSLLPYRLNYPGSHLCFRCEPRSFIRSFAAGNEASGLCLNRDSSWMDERFLCRGTRHAFSLQYDGADLFKFNLRSISQMCARTSRSK